MSNPKGQVTDLLRKLKYDTDTAIKSLQAFNTTLGELMPRVEEVESLEGRAAGAKRQFDDATKRYQETQAALVDATANLMQVQTKLGSAATDYQALRTKVYAIPN